MARELTVCAVGDFCPFPRAGAAAQELFAGVQELLTAADLRVVNVEVPLVTKKKPIVKSGPHLSAPPAVADLLTGHFEVALLANNHILDHGPEVTQQTIAALRRSGLRTVGAGKDQRAASRPLTLSVKGFSLAIVNACEHEFCVAGRDSAGGAGLQPFHMIRTIGELRAKHDLVLVFTHGGNEMNPLPSPRVAVMSRTFAEAGASAVINTHPHVPQAVEVWKGTPIAYSLGNFVFDSRVVRLNPEERLWWIGLPVLLTFREERGGIKASLKPVFTKLDPASGRLDLVRGQERTQLTAWLREISAVLRDDQLLRAYFEAWATVHGAAYYPILARHGSDTSTRQGRQEYAGFRNIWTCEAHNELIRTFTELQFERRVKAARARLGTLRKWMVGEVAGA